MEHLRLRRATVIRVSRQCAVYGLFDPRDPAHIRYVGHAFDTRQRLREHLRESGRITRKGRWLASLSDEDVLPELVVLERGVPPEQALIREASWIDRLLRAGHNLTNAPTQDVAPRTARRRARAAQ